MHILPDYPCLSWCSLCSYPSVVFYKFLLFVCHTFVLISLLASQLVRSQVLKFLFNIFLEFFLDVLSLFTSESFGVSPSLVSLIPSDLYDPSSQESLVVLILKHIYCLNITVRLKLVTILILIVSISCNRVS